MKNELGSYDVNKHSKNPKINLDEKKIYQPYDVQLLSILKDAAIITDENFFITYWNPAAEKIYGWKASEVMGKDAQKVLRTDFLGDEEPDTVKELIHTGSYENDVIQYTKMDFPLYISTKVVNITDDNGVIKGHMSINRDMTPQKNTEKKLERSYNILNSIVENSTDAIYLKSLDGKYITANSTMSQITGKPLSEILGQYDWELFSTNEAEFMKKSDKEVIKNGETLTFEEEIFSHIDGEMRSYLSTKGPYRGHDNNILGIFGIARDITYLKISEEMLKKSEKKYRTLFETMIQGVVYQDKTGKITAMNPAAEKIMGYTLEEIQGRTSEEPLWQSIYPDGTVFPGHKHPSMVALKTGVEVEDVVMGLRYPNKPGHTWLNIHAVPQFRDGEKEPYQVYTTFTDITLQRNAENELRCSEERYHSLFNKMTEGFALHEILLNNEGKPYDYRFLDVNPAFEELTGLKMENILGKLKSEVIPDDNVDWVSIYGEVVLTGESKHFEAYSDALKKHYDVLSFSTAQNQFAVLFTDITERKKVENELKKTLDHLKRSNNELEQFAYVASHDLKEPLRMITSFLQLLQKRYGNKLDNDANDFIDFAVDGAMRMHELIDDLLTYSHLNNDLIFTEVDMNSVLEDVKQKLDNLITENKAIITSDSLPTVNADETQMVQLLENLISNSIKYQGQMAPEIHISAYKNENEWIFSIEDNGIGISPEYTNHIFKIFKRLHGIGKYEGTGIGLAISKRIVERHDGKIWVDNEVIEGTKFNFTIRS
jgi:PAS domain S-box-containing protein